MQVTPTQRASVRLRESKQDISLRSVAVNKSKRWLLGRKRQGEGKTQRL